MADQVEVTVRCGCSRTMQPDGLAGPGRYRCGCGARITLAGLPRLDHHRCPVPRGTRICRGPKDPDQIACQPCTVMIAKLALADPECVEQLAETQASVDFHQKYEAHFSLFREHREEQQKAFNRREEARKVCVVYYCELRPGVLKVGTTTQLGIRMDSFRVPAASVLAAEPGYFKLENLRHRQFAALRIDPNREDFRDGAELREHIAKVRDLHGNPFELVTRIYEMQQELAEDPNSELPFTKVG